MFSTFNSIVNKIDNYTIVKDNIFQSVSSSMTPNTVSSFSFGTQPFSYSLLYWTIYDVSGGYGTGGRRAVWYWNWCPI
jgi:hypothetical protein